MIDKAPTLEVMRGWVAKHRQKQTPIQQFDISIDVNGQWFHEGSPIRREKMVALFASILTRLDDGQFALVTPGEIGIIAVADAPFIITKMEIVDPNDDPVDVSGDDPGNESGNDLGKISCKDRVIQLMTLHGDIVTLDADHRIILRQKDGSEKPYIIVRGGLEALINRAVYYELVDASVEHDGQVGVWSAGLFHPLSDEQLSDQRLSDERLSDVLSPASNDDL